jgi:signal transduction histidine kinase
MVNQDSGGTVVPTLDTRSGPQPAESAGVPGGRKPRRTPSRWTPRNWRMRWRVLALVLIPSVAAIALGTARIQAARSTANNAADIQQLSILGRDITSLAESIQDERALAAGFVAARDTGQVSTERALLPELKAQELVTNTRVATVQGLAGQIGPGFPAVARTDLTFALSSIDALSELRTLTQGQGSEMSSLPLVQHYSNVISQLLAFDDDIAAGSSSAQLEQTVTSLNALAQTEEQASQQQGILYAALLEGQFEQGALSALTAAESSQESDLASFQSVGTTLPAYMPGSGLTSSLTESQQFNNIVVGPSIDEALGIELDATTAGNGQPLDGSLSQPWFSEMSATVGDMRTVEGDLLSSITAQASSLRQGAESSEELTAVLVFILLLAVLAVSIIFARSMIGPLRKLRADALDVASHRLPDVVRRLSESEGGSGDGEKITIEPIGIDSTDEIGEVARAFDQVHSEAVRLAGDEAMLRANLNAMFVNLSRRSQTLIERQLGIIDTLEQSEQDPDRLSNLFRLDHLATRMRRNSENLLVLAGHEAPRKWSQPVPLVDVLRAAISEIEQYDRIMLNVQPGVVVSGRAASDVVHLVAELAENATSFSPEETPVNITGQQVPTGGVLLEISDGGLGITEQDLAYANWRLENPPVVDVAVSRRMGLFVVGRLAARHGIRVRLQHAHGGGLCAMIWLPDTVATAEETPPLGRMRRRFDADAYNSFDVDAYNTGTTAMGTAPSTPATASRPSIARAQAAGPTWPAFRPRTRPIAVLSPQATFSQQTAPPQQTAFSQSAPPSETPGSRLPIFDSVESDWFRRGGLPRGQGSEPVAGSWSSPADDGFRAARAAESPSTEEMTAVGLPKRAPGANLVPGSVGSGQAPQQESQRPEVIPATNRAPDEVRRRMAGFQRGAREGRAAAPPGYGTDEN